MVLRDRNSEKQEEKVRANFSPILKKKERKVFSNQVNT
jgi:hypothetical protein